MQIDGRSIAVNAEFARQVAFLSQQLNCSERYLAGVLHNVLTDNPTIGQVKAVELVVIEYHNIRRNLADCLSFIFEAAVVAQKGYGPAVYGRVNEFAKRQLVGGGADGSLAYRVFAELERLSAAIADARRAVTNAVSNTNIPGFQGELNLSVDVDCPVTLEQEEMRLLGMLCYPPVLDRSSASEGRWLALCTTLLAPATLARKNCSRCSSGLTRTRSTT